MRTSARCRAPARCRDPASRSRAGRAPRDRHVRRGRRGRGGPRGEADPPAPARRPSPTRTLELRPRRRTLLQQAMRLRQPRPPAQAPRPRSAPPAPASTSTREPTCSPREARSAMRASARFAPRPGAAGRIVSSSELVLPGSPQRIAAPQDRRGRGGAIEVSDVTAGVRTDRARIDGAAGVVVLPH